MAWKSRMMSMIVCLSLVALAGCAGDPSTDGVEPTPSDAPDTKTGTQDPQQTTQPPTPDPEPEETPEPEPEETPEPEPQDAPERELARESFTGSLPLDGAFDGVHTLTVPAGATRLDFTYTSVYTGLFTAVAHAHDPAGETALDSLSECSPGLDPGTGTEVVCAMSVQAPAEGEWTFEVHWQLGQVTEDYTLDVVVWGR